MAVANAVSRMGALAFTLGLAVVVATGGAMPVASAAPDDTGDATSSAASSSSTSDTKQDSKQDEKAQPKPKPKPHAASKVADDKDSDPPKGTEASGVTGSSPKEAEGVQPTRASACADDSSASTDGQEAGGASKPLEPGDIQETVPEGTGEVSPAAPEQPTGVDLALDNPSATTGSEYHPSAHEPAAPASNPSMTAPAPRVESKISVNEATPMSAISVGALPDAPTPITHTATNADELVESPPAPARVGLVPRLLSMLGVSLPQFITDGSRVPSLPALALAVLTAVGREIDRFFFNDAPVLAPRQVFVTSTGGVVFGTVGATDADGDPLVYTVTGQPKYGAVEVDANGIWIYTPKDGLFSAGGECGPTACFDAFGDSFTVKVEDRGFNIRKLAAFLTGAPTGVTTRVGADLPTTYTGAGSDYRIRVYEFHNATSGPLQLVEFSRSFGFMPTPPYLAPKQVLEPGETQRFEFNVSAWLTTGNFPSPELVVNYRSADGQTTWPVSFLVNRNESIVEGPGCRSGHGGGICAMNLGSNPFVATDITWVFMDRPRAA